MTTVAPCRECILNRESKKDPLNNHTECNPDVNCYKIFFDSDNLNDLNTLLKIINNTQYYILIITPNYLKSKWCMFELYHILESIKNSISQSKPKKLIIILSNEINLETLKNFNFNDDEEYGMGISFFNTNFKDDGKKIFDETESSINFDTIDSQSIESVESSTSLDTLSSQSIESVDSESKNHEYNNSNDVGRPDVNNQET